MRFLSPPAAVSNLLKSNVNGSDRRRRNPFLVFSLLVSPPMSTIKETMTLVRNKEAVFGP